MAWGGLISELINLGIEAMATVVAQLVVPQY